MLFELHHKVVRLFHKISFLFVILLNLIEWENPFLSLSSLALFTIFCFYPTITISFIIVFITFFVGLLENSGWKFFNNFSYRSYSFKFHFNALVGWIYALVELHDTCSIVIRRLKYLIAGPFRFAFFLGALSFVCLHSLILIPNNLKILLLGYSLYFQKYLRPLLVLLFKSILQILLYLVSKKRLSQSKGFLVPSASGNKSLIRRTVYILERERYWIGLGWTKHFFPDPFEYGFGYVVLNKDLHSTIGLYSLLELDYHLKFHLWLSNHWNTEEIFWNGTSLKSDLNGWVYFDNKWNNHRSYPNISCFTRARLLSRDYVMEYPQ